MLVKKTFKIGPSTCVLIPKWWCDQFNESVDRVSFEFHEDSIVLKPVFKE